MQTSKLWVPRQVDRDVNGFLTQPWRDVYISVFGSDGDHGQPDGRARLMLIENATNDDRENFESAASTTPKAVEKPHGDRFPVGRLAVQHGG